MKPLAGPRAQIVRFLEQIVAIGEHRRSWRRADVLAVAHDSLDPGHLCDRRLAAERRRADAAEAEAARLRDELQRVTPHTDQHVDIGHHASHPHRTVALTELQADIVQRACRGATATDIARATNLTPSAITNHLYRAAIAMGADHTQHGVALVQRGVVEVRIKTRGKRAA